jgi:hypothetical protein
VLKRAGVYHVPDHALPLERSVAYPVALGGNSAFMEGYMRVVIIAAAVAVASISFAGAAEVKMDTTKTKAPVVAGKTMSETDMDKVTAGYHVVNNHGINYHSNPNIHAIDNGFNGHNSHAASWTY